MQTAQPAIPEEKEVQLNNDLLRDILFAIEGNRGMNGYRDFFITSAEALGIADHDDDEVRFHLKMLIREGLVDGDERVPIVRGITIPGQGFLDNTKTESVWETVKSQAYSTLKAVSLKTLSALAEAEVKRRLGL